MLATAELFSPPRLDPRARRLIPRLSFVGDVADLDPADVRRSYNRARQPYTWPLEQVGNITSIARSHDGTPAIKIIRPLASEARDSYLFFHGGGWTLGDLTTYEPLCRRLANRLNANIIWVEYRLAPEHPFPATLDDAASAALWLIKHAEALGLARDRLSLMGDSAGANIAAVLALLNRRGDYGARFRRQVLIYPCLDLTAS